MRWVRDIAAAFRRVPTRADWRYTGRTLIWAAPLMLVVAWTGGLAAPTAPPPIGEVLALAITLAVAPALGEELLFRVILIRRGAKATRWAALSTILFVLWHPLQAITIGPAWAGAFLDPWFLACVGVLGWALARIYMRTGSIWPCVLVHWLTVLVWKTLLGGPF